MQLIYNSLDLTTLGSLRVLGRATRREPVEAPQRERVEYRVRLDFFQQSFAANFAQVELLRAALTTNQATLTWSDNAQSLVARPVTAGDDEWLREPLEKGGTYWQAVEFSFWYYNHAVASNTLGGTFTRAGGPAQDLGAVDAWAEKLTVERYDPLRSPRKRVTGTVTAAGRWQADTTQAVDARRTQLLAKKDALLAELLAAAQGTLTYGSFNQAVRVAEFDAQVNQAQNAVAWSATFTFTRYPDEADYALLEYSVTPRENLAEGIAYLTLAGRIQAPTEPAARARLTALVTELLPAGYALLHEQTAAQTVGSETTGGTGDGRTFTELTFTLEFRDTSALPATYQNLAGGPGLVFALGTVDKFKDTVTVTRLDDLRDLRKRTAGQVALSGKWYVSDALAPTAQQAALTAQKQLFDAQIVNGDRGALVYGGIFNQTVRVTEFTAEINRLTNCIEWSLTATWTRYPNEADYAQIDLKIARRENKAEGIQHLTLSGKVLAPSEAAANARLQAQAAAIVPSGYILLDTEIAPAQMTSETTGGAGDGTAFIEISFTLQYRDVTGIACTYQRAVANAPVADLGTVDRFSSRTTTTLFDEMRSVRKRAAGQVTLSGKWYASDTLSDAAKQTQLLAQQATLRAELVKGASGVLSYGAAFQQTVRVLDFDAPINRLRNCLEWSLSASYTAYPNEADYALAEVQVGTRNNDTDGTVYKTLTGRIAAQSPEAAQSKLARLRTALIPAGYVLQSDGTEERRVSSESGLATTGQNQGDGDAFIELTINDVWQLASGSVLEWTLRIATDDDIKSPTVRTTYSGTVRAAASDQPTAFAAAAVQASALGGNKFPMQVRSNIVELDKLFQTTGKQVFVTVEFSYEYETQNNTTYLEVTSTRAVDYYGSTTETVSGFLAAPSIAAAEAAYQANVRSLALVNGVLLLSERKPTLVQQNLLGTAVLEGRYDFSLQLLRAKDSGQNSIRYDVQVTPDFRSLELSTTVSGTVWGATQPAAEAFLQTVLTGLGLTGKLVSNPRTPHWRSGPQTGGSGVGKVLESMDFSVTYVSLFTGVAGILESEVTEELLYSGQRNVEKMIPDGPSIIQQCGTTCGQHTVTARCRATTKTAADAWVRSIRTALLQSQNGNAGAYEDPPRISARLLGLPQVALVPTGGNANVAVYETTGTFAERIPELVFS